jgi:FkbM family methyltransferase
MKHLPNASFLAVEPLEEHCHTLEELKNEHCNFDFALCVAGSDDNVEVVLNVTEDLDGSTVDGQNIGAPRISKSRTIDSLVAEKHLPRPYLLKFDTHGYEVPILEGSVKALDNTNAILMETYNVKLTEKCLNFYEMCHHMEKLGFRCADIADPILRKYDKLFWQIDLLFLRADSSIFDYQHYQ